MQGKQGDYPIPQSNVAEFKRLASQDGLFNNLFPLFPPGVDRPGRVLDVACGTGGWLRGVRDRYPFIHCVGLDANKDLLDRAQELAITRGTHITFQKGDMRQLLDIFKKDRFDYIQMRASSWFLGDRQAEVFSACQQLLTPSGVFCVIDFSQPFDSNSANLRRFNDLFFSSLLHRGTSYTGTAGLTVLFRRCNFQNIQLSSHVLDLGAGSTQRDTFIADLKSTFHIFKPMVVGSGLITDESYDELHEQCLADIDGSEFGMLAYALTITGQKP